MILLGWAAPAEAGCDSRSLQDALQRAESAFVEMNETGFDAASADAIVALGCMTDVLAPVEVAGFHRVNALRSFLAGDHARTTLYFLSVRESQPGYALPEDVAPAGHPLRADFDASKQFSDNRHFALDPPSAGWLLVDGQRTLEAPSGRPFVLQWVRADGTVGISGWVDVGRGVPEYPHPTAAVPTKASSPSKPKTLQWVGVGTLGAGGLLYGSAFVTRARYASAVDEGDEDRIRGAHTTTNVLTGAGVALLTGGALLTFTQVF